MVSIQITLPRNVGDEEIGGRGMRFQTASVGGRLRYIPRRNVGLSPFGFRFYAAILKEPFWVEVLSCERVFDE